MKKSSILILASIFACCSAFLGDLAITWILGSQYQGYNQLKNTLSSLGVSESPVSAEISVWWVVSGVLLSIFAFGVANVFSDRGKYAKIAAWLIFLYALGDGIGSGAFKANYVGNELTTVGFIHDTVGGIGVTGILILPLIMLKVIPETEIPGFKRFSLILFFTGIVSIFLFLFRFSSDQTNFLSIYKGLWQRLFIINVYIYLIRLALIMIKKIKTKNK
jgi:hypothetical protein